MTSSENKAGASSDLRPLSPSPSNLSRLDGQFSGRLDIKARYHSDRCGGDFFDGVVIGDRVVFLLTDIAGRRSQSHAIAVDVQNIFRARAQILFQDPGTNESEAVARMASELNRSLIEAAHGARFSPTFLGCFNLPLGILTYHNAGRQVAVFRDAEGARILQEGGIPLGLFSHITYEPVVLAFAPRAKLLVVTKGVTECSRGNKQFGAERVQLLLESLHTDSASEICDAVLAEAYAFGSHPWARLYDFLHPGRRHGKDDLTAVALVRPA